MIGPESEPSSAHQEASNAAKPSGTEAPAFALSSFYLATAQAMSLAAHNAVAQQQYTNQLAQAATAQGIALLLGGNPTQPFASPPDTNPLNTSNHDHRSTS